MDEDRYWHRWGAQVMGPATGRRTRFRVWAPRARAVSVIGDFNDWLPDVHAMRRDDGGAWVSTIDDVGPGDLYQYSVLGADGHRQDHADPVARASQIPPQRASIVTAESSYRWHDDVWCRDRADRVPHREPMRVYEVHLGSWRRGLGYSDLIDTLVPHVVDLGFTHVEFMPLTEYPYHGSWGYQVSGYFCPTARYGSPDELRRLIDAFHSAGIAVILDWVPGHFPRDEWALARLDGQPLYEPAEAALHPQWGTLPFDLGRDEVREFLIASALYWLGEFHLDGLRVDAVENILFPPHAHGQVDPDGVRFLRELNLACHHQQPGVAMIAEDASTYPGVTAPVDSGGLGFGFKWSLGWMHDTLRYLAHDPLWRQNHHEEILLPSRYAAAEHWVLPLSHDEVVHGKGPLLDRFPGDDDARRACLGALLAWQWAHPGRPLIFMGTEFGQTREWSHRRSLDVEPSDTSLIELIRSLNAIHAAHPALWSGDHAIDGFRWLVEDDRERNLLAFERRFGNDRVVVVANFSGVDLIDYELPLTGSWTIAVSSASTAYGGTDASTGPIDRADDAAVQMTVPASTTLWLTPNRP